MGRLWPLGERFDRLVNLSSKEKKKQIVIFSIGSFVTLYLFSKRWDIEDSIIGAFACLSRIAASVVYAMAPTRTVYFLGPVLDMFSSAGATSLRSIATKLVETDEVGELCLTPSFFMISFHLFIPQ